MTFQIAVYGVKVVGMKFCGGTDNIPINEPCILERDISNPHDINAVVVLHRETRFKLAFVKKEDSLILAGLFDARLVKMPVFLKAKEQPVYKNKYSGPVQNCNIAFKCEKEHYDCVMQKLSGRFLLKVKSKN